nr:MAG TPA: tail tape measure protein [Caudoviricetes sp.]
MTVEEIEIVVTAKVEEALKEFEKMLPAIKEKMKQVQEVFSKVDTKAMTSKLHQAVNFMKKKMQDLKKSSENNEIAIKVNNKDAQKQISQIQKQIDSLQEKINARQMKLNVINPQIDKIVDDTRKSVTPDGIKPNDKAMDTTIDNALKSNKDFTSLNSQAQKLYTEIEMYNTQLSEAKNKITQLNQETNKTATTQNKLGSFFEAFKQKIEQVKPSISNINSSFKELPKITQNITNNIKGMSTGVRNGLGHILKYAGALFSMQSVYSALSGAAHTWLSSQNAEAKQLNANIEYMKYAVGSALAPVIQFATNCVYQLLKAVQSVVYALFKVNIFAKASASAFKNAQKQAKNTSKQLSNVHNEINNVGDHNSNTSPNIGDMSKIDSQMSPLAQKLYDFFKPLVDSWNKYGSQVKEAFKNAINGIGQAISAMWNSVETLFTNGTIYSIIANILNSIGKIGTAWANAWNNDNNGTELIQGIANMINDVTGAILNLVSSTGFQSFLDGIISAFSGIVQFIEPVVSGFSEMAEKMLEIVASTIGDILKTVGDALQAIAQNEVAVEILKALGEAIAIVVGAIVLWNIAQAILNGLMGLFAIITSPITLVVLAIVAAITVAILIFKNWGTISEWLGQKFNEARENINTAFQNIGQWFEDRKNDICNAFSDIGNWFMDKFNNAKDGVQNAFQNIGNWFKDRKNDITNTFSNIGQWFSDKFNNAVQGIKNAFSSVKTFFSGVWQGICGVFGNVANWFRDKFSQAWQAVKNVFSTGGRIFDGIKEGILSGLKSIVNAIIYGINKVIRIPFTGLNTVLRNIRNAEIMGLRPFSWIGTISVPQIPRLAKGGVLTEATTVLAGEYSGAKTNPEIVTPQNIMRDTFEDVLSNYSGNGQPLHVTIQYLGKEIFDDTIDYINQKTRRTGKCVIKVN